MPAAERGRKARPPERVPHRWRTQWCWIAPQQKRSSSGLCRVVQVADLFQPIDISAVEHICDRDMAHAIRCGSAMPVLHVRRDPDNITAVRAAGSNVTSPPVACVFGEASENE